MATDFRPQKDLPKRLGARKGWGVEMSAAHGDLVYWGMRYARILLSDGFRSFSLFSELLQGRGSDFEHRVLIPDMTPRAWDINGRIWSLPHDFAWALTGRFALPTRADDGHEILPREIAACLGCSVEAYFQRVSRGRSLYCRRLFNRD